MRHVRATADYQAKRRKIRAKVKKDIDIRLGATSCTVSDSHTDAIVAASIIWVVNLLKQA